MVRYDGHVKGRAAEIAKEFGWPDWVIKHRATELGITAGWSACRRKWTPPEEDLLIENAGHMSVGWMARKLNRTKQQVVLKLKRMMLSRRMKAGYTMGQLMLCFGVDHHLIRRWIHAGWLPDRRRDEAEDVFERRSMCITDADLLKFIYEHPMDFELRRVDQRWFMDLVLAGELTKKARAAAIAAEVDDDGDTDIAAAI